MIKQINFKLDIDKIPEPFMKYLEENWTLLAASAYANYLRHGRGLLWVDWLNQLPVATRIKDVPVIYCTPHGAITRSLFRGGMSEDVWRLIRQYDPDKMIVIRWNDNEVLRTRTIALLPQTPIQAYEEMHGQLSEFELLVKLEGGDRG